MFFFFRLAPKMDQNPELEYRQNICYDQKDVKLDEVFRTNIFVKIFESLTKILNLELLKDPIFILFTVSDFANALGYYIPFFCIVDHAIELDISKDRASYLLSIIGISNTLSRVIFGYISDKLKVNRLWIYSTSLCICGLCKEFLFYCLHIFSDFFTFFSKYNKKIWLSLYSNRGLSFLHKFLWTFHLCGSFWI